MLFLHQAAIHIISIQLLTKIQSHHAVCILWNFSIKFCSQVIFLSSFYSNSNTWSPLAWDFSWWAVFRWRKQLDVLSAIETMKITEIISNNKLIKPCLEILSHQKFALLISQFIFIISLIPLSTYNLKDILNISAKLPPSLISQKVFSVQMSNAVGIKTRIR